VKNEARYRDAFLEEFNDAYGHENLRAYAEVDKVDLLIVNIESKNGSRWNSISVHLDMAKRVFSSLLDFDQLVARVADGSKATQNAFLRDCDRVTFSF